MKKFTILLITLFAINIANAQWVAKDPQTFHSLKSVYFASPSIGYVVGENGTIIKTINGGNDWVCKNSGTEYCLETVCFTSPLIGFAAGCNDTILKTTDGGNHWIRTVRVVQKVKSIYFVDSITGFAACENNKILKTTNGGNDWFNLTSGLSNYNDFFSIVFTDINTGYVTCYDNNNNNKAIIKTTNGGTSWESQTLGTGLYNISYSICFPTTNIGYAVGASGIIHKTTNGGISWDEKNIGTGNCLYSVFFIDANIGYVVGVSTILKTTNGGTSWTQQVPYEYSYMGFSGVFFTDENNGIIVGGSGTLLKTTNGGSNWVEELKARSDIKVYPSPANSQITIEFEEFSSQNTLVSIFNLMGKEVFKSEIRNLKSEIDIKDLPSGVYFVRVINERGVSVGKFIKQ